MRNQSKEHIAEQVKERPILFNGEMVRAILGGRKTHTRRIMASKFFRLEMCNLSTPPHLRSREYQNRRGDGLYESGSGPFNPSNPSDQRYAASFCPYGMPGDRLWVRETWAETESDAGPVIAYRAGGHMVHGTTGEARLGTLKNEIFTGQVGEVYPPELWRPSIFMPRWASRITLEITEIRVQRVQEISEEDAEAEGAARQFRTVIPVDGKPVGCKRPYSMPLSFRAGFANLWDSINEKRGFGWESNPWVWAVSFKRIKP